MTDRVNAVIVVLEKDIRIDDAEDGIIAAIKHLRGVVDVRVNVSSFDEAVAEARVRSDLSRKLMAVLHD
jgi:hypothetical protein